VADQSEYEPHGFGFRWGPMTVTRMASYEPRKGFTAHILGIKTDRANVEVYVTKTGKVRVWNNSAELVSRPAATGADQ
jgi:hypothetical protein